MYIGSLLSAKSPVHAAFSAYRLGTEKDFPVSALPEGKGWRWFDLLDTGVDIHISLDRLSFLDTLSFSISSESGLTSIEVLELSFSSPFSIIARLDTGNGRLLSGGSYSLTIGQNVKKLCLRLHAYLKDICITALDLVGSVWEGPILYPLPAEVTVTGESRIPPESFTVIKTASCTDPDLQFAAKELAAQYEERTYRKLFVSSKPIEPNDCGIIFMVKNSEQKPEEYTIDLSQKRLLLCAGGRNGLLYGMERLIQLISGKEAFPCHIDDTPRVQLRGFHLGLPPREEIGFFKRLVRSLLVPMGYNTLFLQMTAGMQFERHPEINTAWLEANNRSKKGEWPLLHHGAMVSDGSVLSKDEVRELVTYARDFGMEVIPEIQSLGHTQYITLAYPELAEIDPESEQDVQLDVRLADQPSASFYKHSCCPLNEEYYRIIEDIIDEIIEVVRPHQYVHMGHDEVYQIGVCPKCRKQTPAALFAIHVNRIHDYLAQKGYKMMIWSDMLQPVTKYETSSAASELPKDITMLDFIWYFHPELDLEDNLLSQKFPVVMGNMYSSHYPRYESRMEKPGMIGAEVSSWCRADEAVLGREGKLYDLIYSGNMMWSKDFCSAARTTWTQMIGRLLPAIRSALHGIPTPSLDPASQAEPLPFSGNSSGVPPLVRSRLASQKAISFHETMLPVNAAVLADPAHPVPIFLSGEVRSALFGFAALHPLYKEAWKPAPVIAVLTVSFADGTSEQSEIRYGQEVGTINRRYGMPLEHGYYRHTGYQATYFSDPLYQGKCPDGSDLTLYGWEWINTNGKEIASAEIVSREELLVACAAVIR